MEHPWNRLTARKTRKHVINACSEAPPIPPALLSHSAPGTKRNQFRIYKRTYVCAIAARRPGTLQLQLAEIVFKDR